MTSSVLLYIHGFNSSPLSLKAKQLAAYLAENRSDIEFVCPQIPGYPQQAWQLLAALLKQHEGKKIGLVGSSLGGYLATRFSESYQLPAVVVNPAVKPFELLTDYLGQNENPYTGEKFILTTAHILELKQLEVMQITHPELLWGLVQKGDELLDYRQAALKYQEAKLTVEEGGDHSFVGFERFTAEIIEFLEL